MPPPAATLAFVTRERNLPPRRTRSILQQSDNEFKGRAAASPNARALQRDTAPRSRYALCPPPTSGRFGHASKCQRLVLAALPGKGGCRLPPPGAPVPKRGVAGLSQASAGP